MSDEQLEKAAQALGKSGYGAYLHKLLSEKVY
jgi:hypothetical protein